ncbi:MAG TPA: hypothetical protein DCE41_37695 [Cytophagales bacterium]|nr:hypothetical protein [Cytophagales bacterium]HAA22356.1 hypothetical protein [Cytophagales bacterium]HAP62179.1 hypothetical protein [Cytophagales bacterium]
MLKVTAKMQREAWDLPDTLNLLNALTTEKYPEKAAETLHAILMDRRGLTLISGDAYTYQGPTYVQEATATGSKNIVVHQNKGTMNIQSSGQDDLKSD